MPTTKLDLDIQGHSVEITTDFELWCACGNGICSNTSYKKGTVNHFETYCDECQDKLEKTEKERDNLEQELLTAKEEIERLNTIIDELKNQ